MHLIRRAMRHDDRGITLPEVLIAIALLGIIMVPLSNSLIGFFRNTNATTNRLAESDDAQLAAAYFAQDVQSIGVRNWTAAPYPLKQSVELDASTDSSLFRCGEGGTPVIRMAWDDPISATGTRVVIVSYVILEQQLRRMRCTTSHIPDSNIVVVHNVFSVGQPQLIGSATIPQAISLTILIKAPTNGGSPLTVTLTGQRRQT